MNKIKLNKRKLIQNKLLLLEKQMQRSFNLCYLFSLFYNSSAKAKGFTLNHLGKEMGKDRAQIFSLCRKLLHGGVIQCIKRNNENTYIASDEINDHGLVKIAKQMMEEK
jgi:hypothetical protein